MHAQALEQNNKQQQTVSIMTTGKSVPYKISLEQRQKKM
jgi:hypothetical protein